MTDAIRKRASDIHVEPYGEDALRVRLRIDGVLYEIMQPPLRLKNAITSRIKVMASLDIASAAAPGRSHQDEARGNRRWTFRVSVLPTMFGEKVRPSACSTSRTQLDMTKLGFEELALKDSRRRSTSRSGWCRHRPHRSGQDDDRSTGLASSTR